MRLFVHVEFASQQVGFLAGNDGRRDRHDPRFKFLHQRCLELPVGMRFDGDFDAAEFQFELGVFDRAAVGIAVEIERQLLAIDDAELSSKVSDVAAKRGAAGPADEAGASPWSCPLTGPGQWRGQGDPGGPSQVASVLLFSCSGSSFLFGEQAQGLAQGGDGGGQVNPGASVLPFGFDGFEFDTQAGRQVAFAQTEGLVEETSRLTRQLGASLGGRQLRAAGFDTNPRCFQIGRQALAFKAKLALGFEGFGAGQAEFGAIAAIRTKGDAHAKCDRLLIVVAESTPLAGGGQQ